MATATLTPSALPGPDTTTKAAALKAAQTDKRIAALLEIAQATGWPYAWSDDLYVHDVRALQEHPNIAVVWIPRPTGTRCLLLLEDRNNHEKRDQAMIAEYDSGTYSANVFPADDPEAPQYYHVWPDGRYAPLTWWEAKEIALGNIDVSDA